MGFFLSVCSMKVFNRELFICRHLSQAFCFPTQHLLLTIRRCLSGFHELLEQRTFPSSTCVFLLFYQTPKWASFLLILCALEFHSAPKLTFVPVGTSASIVSIKRYGYCLKTLETAAPSVRASVGAHLSPRICKWDALVSRK